MAKIRRQVLSNETQNDKGFITLNSAIKWSRFNQNPMLLLEHDTERPVGRVEDIKLMTNPETKKEEWTGVLKFNNTPRGREVKLMYEEGGYNGVSIRGAATKVKKGGRVYATEFDLYEVSIVALPSNPDAVVRYYDFGDDQIRLSTILVEEMDGSKEISIESLSASDDALINNFINMNPENENKVVQESVAEDTSLAIGDGVRDQVAGSLNRARNTIQSFPERPAGNEDTDTDFNLWEAMRAIFRYGRDGRSRHVGLNTADTSEGTDKIVSNDGDPRPITAKEEPVALSVEPAVAEKFAPAPEKLDSHKVVVKDMANKTVMEFLSSDEGRFNMREIGNFSRKVMHGETTWDNPENGGVRDRIVALSGMMANDEVIKTWFAHTTFDVDGGRQIPIMETCEKLASGVNSRNFVDNTPDLGMIIWTNMFYRLLLPDNSWARYTQKASGYDRAGIIWVQSAINPGRYFGNRPPLNAPNYLYDDIARGLSTKVFSLQPIVWQDANTDILAYDDRAYGTSEALRIVSEDIHQYSLQRYATEASEIVPMTGPELNAAGNFPINTAAAGNITTPNVSDLNSLTAKFINEDFAPDRYRGTLILDAYYAKNFKEDSKVTSILEKPAGRVDPTFTQFDAWSIYSRSRVVPYNTATSAVLDGQNYYTGTVADDGTITNATPPVFPATVYGAGIAFIPSQVIMALGNVNVHMVTDPNNYGWKMSMDVRYAAGVAREDGVGVKILAPTVVTTTP